MSAYLSFYKNEEATQHLFTVSRVSRMVEFVIDYAPNFTFDCRSVRYDKNDLGYTFEDVEKEIADFKLNLSLLLMQNNYDIEDFKYNLEEYEELLKVFGMLKVIAEMLNDNNDLLWLTYG